MDNYRCEIAARGNSPFSVATRVSISNKRCENTIYNTCSFDIKKIPSVCAAIENDDLTNSQRQLNSLSDENPSIPLFH
jgi:hypothetical protein